MGKQRIAVFTVPTDSLGPCLACREAWSVGTREHLRRTGRKLLDINR